MLPHIQGFCVIGYMLTHVQDFCIIGEIKDIRDIDSWPNLTFFLTKYNKTSFRFNMWGPLNCYTSPFWGQYKINSTFISTMAPHMTVSFLFAMMLHKTSIHTTSYLPQFCIRNLAIALQSTLGNLPFLNQNNYQLWAVWHPSCLLSIEV